MFKKAAKKALIRMVKKIRNYVQQWEEEQKEASRRCNFDQDDFAYPWLNYQLTKLLDEGGNELRPHFTWGMLHAAYLAKGIGINQISVIEFGVAGGNGLISLEKIAEKIEGIYQIGVDVYGFDTGVGLPKPLDYRDCPNLWTESAFPMDIEKLKKRLRKAQLILGLVKNTVSNFVNSGPAPIAFISFDLDYYSSTMQAFRILEADQALLLPRVYCYFDDIQGFTYSEFTGERLAISEFNDSHSMRKISPIYGLRYYLPEQYCQANWSDMMYLAHIFDHPLYGRNDGLVRRIVGSHTDLQ
jgi:hypothetical protein